MNLIIILLFALLCLWAVYIALLCKKRGDQAPVVQPNKLLSFLYAHEKGIAAILLAVGILVRIVFFWSVPDGLNQDEASVSYDAYADLTYGQDRNGDHNPVYSVAWGSGHSSLYITLSKPWIAAFGLNVFTARVTNVLFGILALFAVYGILKRTNHQSALVGLFLFAVCPWHIMMCRWGLECNLFPNVFLIALYLLMRATEKPRWYPAALFVFGLSLYSYGTAYMVVPVFLLLSAIYLLYHKKITWKMTALSASIFVICAIPIVIFLIINALDLPPLNLGFFTVPRLVSGRYNTTVTVLGGDFFATAGKNLITLVRLIFLQNDGLIWNAIPGFGTLYLFSAPFLVVGIIRIIFRAAVGRKRFSPQVFVVFMFVSVLVLGAMSDLNINRANFIFLPLLFAVCEGICFVIKYVKKPSVVVISVYLCAFVLFCGNYFTDYRAQIGRAFFAGAGEAILYASDQTDGTVYLTDHINAPYIIAMFYEKTNPQVFLDTVNYLNPDSECRYVLSFDRYVTGLPAEDKRTKGAAYVLDVTEKSSFDNEKYHLVPFGYYYVATEK